MWQEVEACPGLASEKGPKQSRERWVWCCRPLCTSARGLPLTRHSPLRLLPPLSPCRAWVMAGSNMAPTKEEPPDMFEGRASDWHLSEGSGAGHHKATVLAPGIPKVWATARQHPGQLCGL